MAVNSSVPYEDVFPLQLHVMFHLHDWWEQGYVESKTLVLLFTARFRTLQGSKFGEVSNLTRYEWQNSQQYVLTSLQHCVLKELYSHHIQSFFKSRFFPVQCHHLFPLFLCYVPVSIRLWIYIYIVVDCVLWIYRFFFLVNHMGFPPTVVAACGRWLAFWRTNDSEWHFPMYISTVIYYIFVFSTTLYYYTQACEVD